MGDHFIPALVQKGFGSLGCRLKGSKDFPFLLLPVGVEGFILKIRKNRLDTASLELKFWTNWM